MKSVTHHSSMVKTLWYSELHDMYMWLFWTSIAGFRCVENAMLYSLFSLGMLWTSKYILVGLDQIKNFRVKFHFMNAPQYGKKQGIQMSDLNGKVQIFSFNNT